MDVIDKFDDVLGSDQGTGKGGTEVECLTNIEWHLLDGLSISEQEELHILKLEGTSEIYAKNSGRSESSSQCNSEKERNMELLLERNMEVMGKFDDVLGSDQGTGKGGTEAECLTKIDTEGLQDELSISEQEKLQILKLEGTSEIYAKNSGRRESSSQCNNEKERNRELLLERNIDVMGKFDDVLGSDQGTGKGGTEAECLTNTVTVMHFPDESQNSQLESSDEMYEENGRYEAEKHCLEDKSRDYSSQCRDISNLYAKNEANVKPAKHMEQENRIEDRMENDREIQPKLINKTAKGESEVTKGKENILEWHLQDELSISEQEEWHILKLEGTSEIHAKNSGRRESSSQCNSEKEWNRELLLERNIDVMVKFDDIFGSDQGTEKDGTEAECLTNTEWHLKDDLSISEQEELHILKLEGTSKIYAKNSARPESSSQCNSEKEHNRELLLEWNRDVIDKFDDVLGSDQGPGKGGTEAECLTNIEWHLPDGLSISEQEELHILKLEGTSEIYAKNSGRSESSSQCNSEKEKNRELLLERNMDVMGKYEDVLGSDQGTGKGGTEAECLTKIDTEWHLQDELSISEQEKLQILKLEGTSKIYAKNSGRPESSSQYNSEKESNRELLLERSIDVMGKFDDVLGSDQGTGKGGTEAECLTNTETHFPDESQNSQLESSDKMYEENGKFEAEKLWLDDKSRDCSSQCRDISSLYAKNEVNIKPAKRMEEENRIEERIEDKMEKDREIQPKLRNKTAKGESEVTKGKENILVTERHLQHELQNLKMEEFDKRYAVTNKVEREKHMPKDKIRRYCSSQIKDINERDKDFPSGMAARGPMNDIFCRDPRAENGGTEQECMREIDNEKIDYDEPSSSNHANMQQRKTIKEVKLQDSNHRIKSTIKRGNTNSYTERGEHKRLRSQGEKQPHGDAEGSAFKASKLDFCADRIWSLNQHRNKDNSSVSDKQSENSPSPHINKSQNRHCLVCRSRQAESPQRESTARKKSRPNISTTVHKGPTSEVRKRDSEYTHSKKLYSTVSDISSKNSPSSYVIKNQSRRLSRKTDKTRTEPSSQDKPIASASSNDSSSRVCKRDSSIFCKQSKISSNSCAINDQRGFKSKQSRSTQKEPLSREKVHASGESTIGQGSTSGLCKRDPQFQHSEMVESSVNHRSKSSLNTHVMEDRSRSTQGSSTPSGSSSHKI